MSIKNTLVKDKILSLFDQLIEDSAEHAFKLVTSADDHINFEDPSHMSNEVMNADVNRASFQTSPISGTIDVGR